ncbi:hypothetical protein [Breoghania sp.]|uniref:hypothetical protein n=1 Tax=Breoghania sp. TaxID=2065378 RepID=UPI00262FA75C|nr:hypothetical protein [Breoghania sp.]MDJ0931696.1 hypothetical protein [Breoghania sp.]
MKLNWKRRPVHITEEDNANVREKFALYRLYLTKPRRFFIGIACIVVLFGGLISIPLLEMSDQEHTIAARTAPVQSELRPAMKRAGSYAVAWQSDVVGRPFSELVLEQTPDGTPNAYTYKAVRLNLRDKGPKGKLEPILPLFRGPDVALGRSLVNAKVESRATPLSRQVKVRELVVNESSASLGTPNRPVEEFRIYAKEPGTSVLEMLPDGLLSEREHKALARLTSFTHMDENTKVSLFLKSGHVGYVQLKALERENPDGVIHYYLRTQDDIFVEQANPRFIARLRMQSGRTPAVLNSNDRIARSLDGIVSATWKKLELRTDVPKPELKQLEMLATKDNINDGCKKGEDNHADVIYRQALGGGSKPELIYANFHADGHDHRFYAYEASDVKHDFLSPDGESMTKFLLRLPAVDYTRNGDPFGWRMHPVLHRRLFHNGNDYPAPMGLP